MEMEHAAEWGPSELQLANWSFEEPAAGDPLPAEYVSVDIFGTCCSLQAYVPESSGGQQQLVENNYCTASRDEAIVVLDGQNRLEVAVADPRNIVVSNDSYARDVLDKVEHAFKEDTNLRDVKMHRYPAGFRDTFDKRYTVPRIVAIGPYHHQQPHLKQTEKVKHMAVIRCVKESKYLLEEVYDKVASVADEVRGLYDKDVMAGISYVDFRDMMLVDACFLVQYMRVWSGIATDPSLTSFLVPNGRDLRHDILLLENQLPWKVVETVMDLVTEPSTVPLGRFISSWKGYLQHRKLDPEDEDAYAFTLVQHESFKPHLLGLLRYYTVGRSRVVETSKGKNKPEPNKTKSRSFSISAIELAEIGISLTANKSKELTDMSLNQKGTLLAELSVAPLSLDLNRASFLFNMAALELCTGKSYSPDATVEDSAVCSYLLLLALLVCREEDVQELRARGVLQGGGGLTDEEAFRFFTSFQGLSVGPSYARVMRDIESYRDSRWKEAKFYAFYYKNKKTIAAVVTGVGALVGIIGTLVSIKTSI